MENKELYRLDISEKKINILGVLEEGIKIDFDGEESIEIYTKHESDCCENAWGDFDIMKYYEEKIKGKTFDTLIIKGVEDMGFLLCFEKKYGDKIKVFIPCYSSNNGYYSDNLSLIIKRGEIKTEIDIRNLHEDTD